MGTIDHLDQNATFLRADKLLFALSYADAEEGLLTVLRNVSVLHLSAPYVGKKTNLRIIILPRILDLLWSYSVPLMA